MSYELPCVLTIIQAPPGALHHWLCMNAAATIGEAFPWCHDKAGHPQLTPACGRCVIQSPSFSPSSQGPVAFVKVRNTVNLYTARRAGDDL